MGSLPSKSLLHCIFFCWITSCPEFSLWGSEGQCQSPGSSSCSFPAGLSEEGCLGCSGVSCASVDLSRSPQHFCNYRGIRCLCMWVLLGYIRHCSNQILPTALPKSCCRDTHTLHTRIPGHPVLFGGGFENLKRWDPAVLDKAWELVLQVENPSGREIPRPVLCCHFPIGSTVVTNIQLQAVKKNRNASKIFQSLKKIPRVITTAFLTKKKALIQGSALCSYHLQTVLGETNQLTATFA